MITKHAAICLDWRNLSIFLKNIENCMTRELQNVQQVSGEDSSMRLCFSWSSMLLSLHATHDEAALKACIYFTSSLLLHGARPGIFIACNDL